MENIQHLGKGISHVVSERVTALQRSLQDYRNESHIQAQQPSAQSKPIQSHSLDGKLSRIVER